MGGIGHLMDDLGLSEWNANRLTGILQLIVDVDEKAQLRLGLECDSPGLE